MNETYYIKKIEIENIKCFSKRITIPFYKPDSKKLSNWNLILGDNGSGKTTLLKSIYLAIADDFYLGKEDNFSRYPRDSKKPAYIRSSICKSWKTNDEIDDKIESFRRSSFLEEFNIQIEGPSIRTSRKRVPVFAYGATRRSGSNFKNQRRGRFELGLSLFDENTALVSAEEWILEADYSSRISKNKRHKNDVIEILKKLFKGIISDIRVKSRTKKPTVEFKTNYGWVELNELSLGYKTMVSWLVDFVYKLAEYYFGEKQDLFSKHAIVIIDEIDLHLHVTFQKKLVKFLTSTFKNVQFIVTAHSPLIVQASSDANIILLKRYGSSSKPYENEHDISKWRIDQIYSSDLFGNVSVRKDNIERLIKEKSKILLKKELTHTDKSRLKAIDAKISDIPTGNSPLEIEAIEILKKAAKIYKRK